MTAMDWVGRVIDGRYVVEALIGRGGMGVVLAARHKFTGARVALKMVRSDLGLDAEIESRFLAEARMPATIGHRSVVKTLDAGKTPEGELYLVMELLAGRSLRHEMMRGVGAPSVRRIGMELLDVLAAAHARGIVHRDVKPENVFLVEPDASVKLLDFGITKVLAGPKSMLPRTAAGVLLGTIEYMAPEQLADARGVDARADLWAVSVMLYEMLAGRRPHRATNVEEMFVALVKGEPDPIRLAMPSATPDIEAFFSRGLEREPDRRFASAAEMAVALARLPLAVSAPVVARPASGYATMATGFTSGNATMATGFAVTAATPASVERGLPSSAPMPGQQAMPAMPSAPMSGQQARPVMPGPPMSGQQARPAMPSAPMHGRPAMPGPPMPGRMPPGVLTPFVATPALAGALPDPPPPPPPQTAPSYGRGAVAVAPTTGTIATVARTIETSAARPRRRVGWTLGALAVVALGAGIVVAVSRGGEQHPASPPPGLQPSAPQATNPSSPVQSPAAPSSTTPSPAPATASAATTPAPPSPANQPPLSTSATRVAAESNPATAAHATSSGATRGTTTKAPAASPATQRGRRAGAPSASHPALDPAGHAAGALSPAAGVSSSPAATASRSAPASGTSAMSPTGTPQSDDTCAAGCKMLAGCRLGSASCEADCAQNRTLHGCLQQAASDCTRFASCWFGSSCRVAPSGTHSCSEAMNCEARCRNDTSCICSCVAGLSAKHAVALLAYNGCALQCRDNDCIQQRCSAQASRCRAE